MVQALLFVLAATPRVRAQARVAARAEVTLGRSPADAAHRSPASTPLRPSDGIARRAVSANTLHAAHEPLRRRTALSSRLFTRVLGVATLALAVAARETGAQAAPESRAVSKDSYVEAAGLRPLRFQLLPRGTREIRVWVGGGIGWPQEVFRLVEHDGRQNGEYVRYWRLDDRDPVGADGAAFAALMRYHERGRCEPVSRGRSAEACRALFQSDPDWRAVWRAADSLGVWSLPDASTLREVLGPNGERTITLDGWGITVELRDGPDYRVWHYSNPDRKQWPEAARAMAFAAALRPVRALLRRSAEERVFVGRVDVRADTVEFSPCGGGGPWLLVGRVEDLVGSRREARPPVPTSRVEVRATLAPEWVARDWWHVPQRYHRTVQADSVLAVTPWGSGACSRSDVRTP